MLQILNTQVVDSSKLYDDSPQHFAGTSLLLNSDEDEALLAKSRTPDGNLKRVVASSPLVVHVCHNDRSKASCERHSHKDIIHSASVKEEHIMPRTSRLTPSENCSLEHQSTCSREHNELRTCYKQKEQRTLCQKLLATGVGV